jgi:hypothetical protein
VGTARITATLGTITGATTLQVTDAVLVSLAVTPVDPTLPAGLSLQLTATGTFSDASMMNVTDQVTWASSSTDVAQVSNAAGSHGLVTTSHLLGGADITATLAGATGGTHLTVTDAVLQSIAVTPADPSVPLGRTQALIAMGTFSDASMRDVTRDATWTSSQPGIASVSDAVDTRGLATALALGTTSITAALTGKTGATMLTVTDPVVTSIEVTPGAAGVSAGRTQAYKATGTFSDRTMHDITDQVTWASQQPTIAQISNAAGSRGVATGLSPGIATLRATLDGHTGLASLTVLDAALDSIAVTPATPSVPAGLTQAFTATGTFSDRTLRDLTGQVTWASSAPSVAQISNATGSRGVATGVASGTATITAKLGQVSGTATLTVTGALLVSLAVGPVVPSVPLGRAQPFTATGTFTDASVRDVTGDASWASSDPTVAPISNTAGSRGVATAQALGTTQISATLSGMTAATTMTVTAPVVASIAVAPGRAAIGVHSTQAFTATGTFTDGTMHELTDQVTWASSEPAAAQVSNTAGSQGVATALAAGTPRITATLAGVTGSAVLSVIDFQRIDFLFGYCDPLTPEAGVTVTGLEFALDRGFDPERFSSVRWLDPTGQAFSIDAPVSELDGSFDGLRCLPASEFLRRVMFGDRLTLMFIGSTTTVTVTFRAVFLTPQSAFSLDQLGVQFVP